MRALFEAVFAPLDALLATIPLAAARICTVAFLVAAAALCLRLPKSYVMLGAPDERWWRDLRWWAVAVMVPYVLIYGLV